MVFLRNVQEDVNIWWNVVMQIEEGRLRRRVGKLSELTRWRLIGSLIDVNTRWNAVMQIEEGRLRRRVGKLLELPRWRLIGGFHTTCCEGQGS